jgi:hypothetical protein
MPPLGKRSLARANQIERIHLDEIICMKDGQLVEKGTHQRVVSLAVLPHITTLACQVVGWRWQFVAATETAHTEGFSQDSSSCKYVPDRKLTLGNMGLVKRRVHARTTHARTHAGAHVRPSPPSSPLPPLPPSPSSPPTESAPKKGPPTALLRQCYRQPLFFASVPSISGFVRELRCSNPVNCSP